MNITSKYSALFLEGFTTPASYTVNIIPTSFISLVSTFICRNNIVLLGKPGWGVTSTAYALWKSAIDRGFTYLFFDTAWCGLNLSHYPTWLRKKAPQLLLATTTGFSAVKALELKLVHSVCIVIPSPKVLAQNGVVLPANGLDDYYRREGTKMGIELAQVMELPNKGVAGVVTIYFLEMPFIDDALAFEKLPSRNDLEEVRQSWFPKTLPSLKKGDSHG